MKIQYDRGPDTVSMGQYIFRRGEATDVPDDIAALLLQKKSIQFTVVKDRKKKEE